jgi:hypothetical protein
MPGRQNVGMLMTILLGIVGSFLGSWSTSQFGYQNANGGFAVLPYHDRAENRSNHYCPRGGGGCGTADRHLRTGAALVGGIPTGAHG